jgi:hypothetical protein
VYVIAHCDLAKLRAKRLVEKVPRTRRYRLLPEGYRVCVVFLTLFERISAPLTAGLLQPFHGDAGVQERRRSGINSIASTSASPMISTACCMPSVSRSRRDPEGK